MYHINNEIQSILKFNYLLSYKFSTWIAGYRELDNFSSLMIDDKIDIEPLIHNSINGCRTRCLVQT